MIWKILWIQCYFQLQSNYQYIYSWGYVMYGLCLYCLQYFCSALPNITTVDCFSPTMSNFLIPWRTLNFVNQPSEKRTFLQIHFLFKIFCFGQNHKPRLELHQCIGISHIGHFWQSISIDRYCSRNWYFFVLLLFEEIMLFYIKYFYSNILFSCLIYILIISSILAVYIY